MTTANRVARLFVAGGGMAERKQVFISRSAQDDAIGRRVVAALEGQGVKCWYSSRPLDLEPGVDWDENIVTALDASIAVVLIFSGASNASKWVRRELAMASARGIPIYPLRAENIRPTGGMEPYLISVQWLDIYGSGQLDEKLAPLIRRLAGEQRNPVPPNENRAKSSKRGAGVVTGPPMQPVRDFIRDWTLFQLGSAMIGSFASLLVIQALPYIFGAFSINQQTLVVCFFSGLAAFAALNFSLRADSAFGTAVWLICTFLVLLGLDYLIVIATETKPEPGSDSNWHGLFAALRAFYYLTVPPLAFWLGIITPFLLAFFARPFIRTRTASSS